MTKELVTMPFTEKQMETVNNNSVVPVSASGSVEQSRAVAEAQAAMVVARKFPRDEMVAWGRIQNACKRLSFAENSKYVYKRGTTLVTGPSIRMAEAIISYWGNSTYGFRELERKGNQSEVEAFAWDLETNVRVTRTFVVKHLRDKTSGSVALKSERDRYEHIANMAQRRVRACILEVIPVDIVEGAVAKCNETLQHGNGVPIEDRIRKMLEFFAEIGVTKEMIEEYLQHKVTAIVPEQISKLTQIFTSIRDGIASREEFFKLQSDDLASKIKKNTSPAPKNGTKGAKKEEKKDVKGKQSQGQKKAEKTPSMTYESRKEQNPDLFARAVFESGFESEEEILKLEGDALDVAKAKVCEIFDFI